MSFKEMLEKVQNYFEENEDDFISVIEDLDSYNGYLGDDRYYCMDELADFYLPGFVSDNLRHVHEVRETFDNLLNRIYYGHDADNWHTDSHGEKEYGAFNPNRDYFTYNGYGNLVSTDYKDYSSYLSKSFVEEVYDNQSHITIPDEVQEIFDEYDNQEEE